MVDVNILIQILSAFFYNIITRVSSCIWILEYMQRHPSLSLLDLVVAYDLFVDSQNYSKSAVANKQIQPVAHVVIWYDLYGLSCVLNFFCVDTCLHPSSDGRYCFSPRIVLTLLAEAAGIPVIFASVSSTGFVMLEVCLLPFFYCYSSRN
jgi:hypothetical protein